MFTFHKPKVFRSANGCCICRAKSSSSRFTDSKRYEAHFEKCFSLVDEERCGEICNACVLLVKRYIKLPAGSTRHWNHVVDARSGPGIKSLVRSKKQKEANASNKTDENDTPEKINKKHFYRSKKKPVVVRKRNPSIPVSGFLDMSRWTKEEVCCGTIFRGPHGEVAIDPRFLKPCYACKSLKEPLSPLPSTDNTSKGATDVEDSMETESDSASVTSNTDTPSVESAASALSALSAVSASKIVDETDDGDEGFFDKPAVSPADNLSVSPPPSETEMAEDFIRKKLINTT